MAAGGHGEARSGVGVEFRGTVRKNYGGDCWKTKAEDGRGRGMARSFIGWMVRGIRKGSEKIWAGLSACHMWATAVAFHAGSANGGGEERKALGKERKHWGRRKEGKRRVLTGRASAQ